MTTYKNINLPFNISANSTSSYNANIHFSSQDGGTAKLTFNIFKDNVPLSLVGTTGKIVFRMADGSKFIDTVTIENAADGVMSYVLTTEELAHTGKVKAELILTFANGTMSAYMFEFTIDQSLADQEITPVAEYYIDDLESFKTSANASLISIVDWLNHAASVASGSPKRGFATLSDLQSTFPTGADGIYVVQSNGHWYYWSGTEWTDGGLYQSAEIADKVITPEKTSFLVLDPRNVLNPYTLTDGYRLDTAGNPFADAAYTLSDYIPVVSGKTYTIGFATSGYSIGRVCGYGSDKAFIKVITSGANPMSAATLDVTVDFNGFIRVPFSLAGKPSATVAEKTVFAGVFSFKYTLVDYIETKPKVNSVGTSELKDSSVPPEKTTFVTTGKNLFNIASATLDYYIDQSGGNLVALANYVTSEYIKVTKDITYTISACRKFVLFDKDKKFVSGLDRSQSAYTFTATIDGYIRFSYSKLSAGGTNVQMEVGSTVTAYAPFELRMAGLALTDEQKASIPTVLGADAITVVKAGETFIITSKFDSAKDITITTTRNGSSNGSFNFSSVMIGTDTVVSNNDDITPIRTFTTVGANHGYTCVIEITMVGHGKTTVDLGSQWTDGTTIYTLLDINGDKLMFGCPYTVTNGVTSATPISPVANLTHVSGATNTALIDITTRTSAPQLYPSINQKSVKYILDGKEITADGTYTGKELQVQESYNVMGYKDIVDYAQANIGSSFKNDAVGGVVRLSITYTFKSGGKCFISHNFKALKKVSVGNCGFLQAIIISLAGHTAKRYMPNVLPISGYDFKNIVDMTSYNASLNVYPASYEDATKPPNRYVDWLYDSSGNKKYGFTMGYIIDKTDSKNSKRVLNTGIAWDLRSTKKSYPVALSGKTLEAGEYLTFMGYRCYLSPEAVGDATNVNVVSDKKDTYVYIDYHQTVSGKSTKLPDHIGKNVTIVDSQNFTLHNDVVDADGVTFSVTNNYGYAVLKLN